MISAWSKTGFLSSVSNTLLVSADASFRYRLNELLPDQGFELQAVAGPAEAESAVQDQLIELIIVDYSTAPDMALSLCRQFRRDPVTCHIPLVMMGTTTREREVVTALWVGADDFIELPCETEVMVARFKTLIRRQAATSCSFHSARANNDRFQVGELLIDPTRYDAYLCKRRLDLTVAEFRILHLLANRAGQVFSREQIVETIHGSGAAVTDRAIDTRIYMLRKKLGEAEAYIETVRGAGYRLVVPR